MKNWIKIFSSAVVFILLLIISALHLNRENIYAKLGVYYTKKGNYAEAQKYYEKSYSLGNQNVNFRENYVNLLINSPLTIEAQERLADIADDKKKDVASESARYFLYNLKREIHNKYPDNYVQQASYNQKIVHWGKMPITYSIKKPKNVSQEIVDAVNDAFDAWERASSARIRFENVSRNADIAVGFINSRVLNPKDGEKYVIASTNPDITAKKLNRMDIVINISGIDGTPFSPNQIYNTALHEIFHALGFMGHSFNKDSIMYPSQTGEAVADGERDILTESDKSTLELLYKIKPDITNANELRYDYISYPVLGDNVDVNYAKAVEARKYINKAPKIPAGYIDLAQTLINQKEYEKAIANLKKALYLSTTDEMKYLSFYNLAVACYMDQDYIMASYYINEALKIQEDESARFLSAEIYLKSNDKDGAVKEYSYLVSKNPDNIEYVVGLTNIYISNRNYMKARKVLKNYIKRNPQERNNPRFKSCRILIL